MAAVATGVEEDGLVSEGAGGGLVVGELEHPSVSRAAEALARRGDPRAFEPRVSALQDPDWRVRRKAAWALGSLGDPRAVIPLRRAMAVPGETDAVKEMIEEAMQEIARKGMG